MIRQFTDDLGRIIRVNFPPQRIISFVPSITELLFDLNLDDEIIGITDYCIHPVNKVGKKEKIGGTKNIKIAKVFQMQPDLIISCKEENVKSQIERCTTKCPVYVCDVRDYESAIKMIKDISELTAREKGKLIAENIIKEFSKIRRNYLSKRTAYLIWKSPWMTVSEHTFIGSMLRINGLVNVFADRPEKYPQIVIDDLLAANPELILLPSEPYNFIRSDAEELQLLFPDAQILLVNGELFSWYGSRMLMMPDYFNSIFI